MDRPHFLVITTHDTGRFIGPYGVATVRTPHLDELATTGVRFNAYTTAPLCSPSRASLTTGRYPHAHGVMGLTQAHFALDLRHDELPLPTLPRPAGYRSGHFGIDHATRDGSRLHNDVFDLTPDPATILRNAAAFLDASHDRPFHVQIGLRETHRVAGGGFGHPAFGRFGVTVPPFLPDTPDTRADLADFQGAVNRADELIGDVLALLRVRKLEERTLVAYVSDHGIPFPRAKCTLCDHGLESALLVRLPGTELSGGRAPRGQVSIMDLAPTLLELAGAPPASAMHGRSLLPVAEGADSGWYALFAKKTFHTAYDPMRGIRTRRWKHIRNFEAAAGVEIPIDVSGSPSYRVMAGRLEPRHHPPAELYDLEIDPDETVNLAGLAILADVEADLHARVVTWMRETSDPLLAGPVPSPFYRDAIAGTN